MIIVSRLARQIAATDTRTMGRSFVEGTSIVIDTVSNPVSPFNQEFEKYGEGLKDRHPGRPGKSFTDEIDVKQK